MKTKFFKKIDAKILLVSDINFDIFFHFNFKLFHIQFYENETGLGIEPESIVKNVILEPSRGNIYASDGNILATSIPRYELHWDSVTTDDYLFETKKKTLADSIASLTGVSSKFILKKLEKAKKIKIGTC